MLLLFVACAPDLPPGWEDAEPIPELTQSECGGDPYEADPAELSATLVGDGLEVVYDGAHFRCSQAVEGFYKVDAGRVSVLVQPVDMNPGSVAKCDCLYRVDMGVPATGTELEVWRRWDNLNDPNDPVLEGTVTVQ